MTAGVVQWRRGSRRRRPRSRSTGVTCGSAPASCCGTSADAALPARSRAVPDHRAARRPATLAVGPSAAPARYRFVPPREAAFDFNLKDQDGLTQSIKSARGKVVVDHVPVLHLPRPLPAEANLIGAAAEKVGNGVTVYAISVDPDGDTPERAKAFVKRRGLDPTVPLPARDARGAQAGLARVRDRAGQRHAGGRDRGRGGDRQVPRRGRGPGQKLARRPYEAPTRDSPEDAADPYPDPDDLSYRGRSRHEQGLDFEHSAYVMLIDKHGRQRVGFRSSTSTVDGLAADLEALKREP